MATPIRMTEEELAERLYDGALRKFRQLEREIGEVNDERVRSNLSHTRSKLGIFLDDALPGDTWRKALELLKESDERRG